MDLRNEETVTTIAILMQKRDWYPDEFISGQELKKLIKNVKVDLQKSKKWDDDYDELYENGNSLEDKIYYGTDTSEEENDFERNHFLDVIADSMKNDLISYNDIIEINHMLTLYHKENKSIFDFSSSEAESESNDTNSEDLDFDNKKSDSSG